MPKRTRKHPRTTTRAPKEYPSKRAVRLIAAIENTAFLCGEWRRDDDDETPYDKRLVQLTRAKDNAEAYIAALESARDAVLVDVAAFRRKTKREEYTDTGEAWETLEYIVATLKGATATGRKASHD